MDMMRGRVRIGQTCRQILSIGAGSQSVVIVTGAFTGAVFTAQVYGIFKDLQVENASGGLVSLAMCRELGPVLVALMITGRVGPVTFVTALALRQRSRAYRFPEERPIIG